jgi:hypothetical protein
MKKEESFFINLFKKKSKTNPETLELKLNTYDDENLENKIENEWFQEYEVIYQSYSLE